VQRLEGLTMEELRNLTDVLKAKIGLRRDRPARSRKDGKALVVAAVTDETLSPRPGR